MSRWDFSAEEVFIRFGVDSASARVLQSTALTTQLVW